MKHAKSWLLFLLLGLLLAGCGTNKPRPAEVTLRQRMDIRRAYIGITAEPEVARLFGGARPRWLNGINLPWINFGYDFGGETSTVDQMESAFSDFRAAGINSVRVWIHCDGRGSPLFAEPDGAVTGLPERFLRDFRGMLDAAMAHRIMVMPVLWSFDMAKPQTDISPTAGTHAGLVTDPELTQSYIDNALIPLLREVDGHAALFAWEICNEPEWMVENHGIPKAAVQRFHGMLAAAIHEHGKKPVTTGSAGLKWHTDRLEGALGNWWSDAALQAAHDHPRSRLDFYQVHFYDWMIPWGFDPYAYTPAELGLKKPVMIGEAPGQPAQGVSQKTGETVAYAVRDMLVKAVENRYFGHYFWSWSSHDGAGEWRQIREVTPEFAPQW